MDWAKLHGFEDKAKRIGKILVGPIAIEDEVKLFEFLCLVEGDMLIDKTDDIGCSKDV